MRAAAERGHLQSHATVRGDLQCAVVAAAVVAGVDRGDELIVPDEPARAAYALKLADRAGYDAQMRATAARLKEREA